MLRLARGLGLLLLCVASLGAPSRLMAAGCDAYKVGSFLSEVPFFSRSMTVVGERTPSSVSLVHEDDRRITATFRLVSVPPEARTTRADYVRAVDDGLQARVRRARETGARAEGALFPYDPVAWTLTSTVRTPPDAGGASIPVTAGTMTIRIAPTCHLVAEWSAPDVTVLAGRIQGFGASLVAVRTFAERLMAPSGFLVDDYVPTGWRAVASGFAVPVLAALALVYLLRNMLHLARPGPLPRILAAALALGTACAIYLQLPFYRKGFETGMYLDDAMLLACALALLAAAAVVGTRACALAGLAPVTIFGFEMGLKVALSWAPDPRVSLVLAVAYVVGGFLGLALWRSESEGRRKGRLRERGA